MKNQHFTLFIYQLIAITLASLLIFTCFNSMKEKKAFKEQELIFLQIEQELIFLQIEQDYQEILSKNTELNEELQLQKTLLIEKEQVNQDLLIKIDELALELSVLSKSETETTLEPEITLKPSQNTENIPSNNTESEKTNNTIIDTNTDSSLKSLGVYELTAYCNCEACCGQWAWGPTASGVMPIANHTVACNSLPLGTKLSIRGQIYIVEDTGGMADNVIDIYFNTHAETDNFGRQTAEVFIVE